MLEHTPVLSLVWQIAAIEAADARHQLIEPEFFFIGLCKLEGFANITRLRTLGVPEAQAPVVEAEIDLLMGLFDRYGISTTTMRHELRRQKGKGTYAPANPDEWVMHRSPQSQLAFERAEYLAEQVNSPVVAAFHLLAGLLDDPQSSLVFWLRTKGKDTAELKKAAAITVLPHYSASASGGTKILNAASSTSSIDSSLTQYGQNLTELAKQGKLTSTSEYEEEVLKMARILGASEANNPLLLATQTDDGEGIVETLAWQGVHDAVPPPALQGRQVVAVDLTELSAEITYQGELADRLQTFLKAAAESSDQLILFIKNIDAIIGSGRIHVDMEGVIQVLITALTNGDFQCIGLTTPNEYQQYIAPKPEFKRLFQPVFVSEPVSSIQPGMIDPLSTDELYSQSAKGPAPLSWADNKLATRTNEVDELIVDLKNRLVRFGVELQIDPSALALLNRISKAASFGVSSLRKTIALEVENPLGGMLLRGEVDYGQSVSVEAAGDKLVVRVKGESIASKLLAS